jgi:hypothetical protein
MKVYNLATLTIPTQHVCKIVKSKTFTLAADVRSRARHGHHFRTQLHVRTFVIGLEVQLRTTAARFKIGCASNATLRLFFTARVTRLDF